jgi:hypothetical protein
VPSLAPVRYARHARGEHGPWAGAASGCPAERRILSRSGWRAPDRRGRTTPGSASQIEKDLLREIEALSDEEAAVLLRKLD